MTLLFLVTGPSMNLEGEGSSFGIVSLDLLVVGDASYVADFHLYAFRGTVVFVCG